MSSLTSRFIQDLATEEIDRMVADAITDGRVLSTSAAAAKIARIYAGSGLEEGDLVNRIISAASAAGVPVEIGTSRSDQILGARSLDSSPGK